MGKRSCFYAVVIILFFIAGEACRPKGNTKGKGSTVNLDSLFPFDSSRVTPFIVSYPLLKKYENDIWTIYRKHNFNSVWLTDSGVNESGHLLYRRLRSLSDEGVTGSFPYYKFIEGIFKAGTDNHPDYIETELMLTGLYLFYADKVYFGQCSDSVTAMGWLLPRKEISYDSLLDSVILTRKFGNEDTRVLVSQYYRLRDALKFYRSVEKNGGWASIELNPELKAYKPNDTAGAIRQIRSRLFITGELKSDNKSSRYDSELVAAVIKYKIHHGYKPDSLIKPEHIRDMNVPVSERVKTIVINMERCRWLLPGIFNEKEYIFVNIPSYKLNFIRDGNKVFECQVVVGNYKTRTAIFSARMSYLVFSPYWTLPKSIIENEIKPAMEKDTNYLSKHHMEWNNGQVRQKPGKFNSLGLVKFMFPNPHEIYFHDTPSKSHFKREIRALSHGCIRVGKPRDLAITILQKDKVWNPRKIDAAMNGGEETVCILKNKIPVYICYFTAWVDESGEINFYKDVYDIDERLAALLIAE